MNLDSENLKNFLEIIKGDRNQFSSKDFHDRVLDKIKKRWESWGIDSTLLVSHFRNCEVRNLFIPPKNLNSHFVLLIAHYDTVPFSPGVDDNGSGLIMIDALIKIYSTISKSKNIAFALVDHEEGDPRIWQYLHEFNQGKTKVEWYDITNMKKRMEVNGLITFIKSKVENWTSFIGTRHLINYLEKDNLIKNISCVINFETCGYVSENQTLHELIPIKESKGDFIGFFSNKGAKKILDQIMRIDAKIKRIPLIVENKGLDIPDTRRSDHSLFWDRDIPAIMVTDTANFRNPNYHKKTDLEVDFDFLIQLINLIQSLLFKA